MRFKTEEETDAGIIVRGIGKRYRNGAQVLENVGFTVRRGESVGIIGRNGAGKSTLLKILAGALRPTAGEFRVRGTCRALLELGAAFHPDCTGRENLRLQADLWGLSASQRQRFLPEAISFAGIGNSIDAPVRTYSTGMFVRLAFAAAVCSTPEILLVDEALSVGDAAFQKKCHARMREIAEQTSMLLVSHDLYSLTRLCGRLLVMDGGRIVFDGPPREAVSVYYRILQAAEEEPLLCSRGSSPEEAREGTLRLSGTVRLQPADPRCMSGEGRVRASAYGYTVDGVPFAGAVRECQEVEIFLHVHSEVDTERLIVGYQVRDRCGTEIFGETQRTSVSLNSGAQTWTGPRFGELHRGESLIRFRFRWPGVREGTYFLTPGIGIGETVLRQKEQCWLNDAIRLDHPGGGRLIYGFFNVPMEAFGIEEVRGRAPAGPGGGADGNDE